MHAHLTWTGSHVVHCEMLAQKNDKEHECKCSNLSNLYILKEKDINDFFHDANLYCLKSIIKKHLKSAIMKFQ